MCLRVLPLLTAAVLVAPVVAAQQPRDTTRDSVLVLDPVVVTAERRPTALSATTAPVRLISRSDITRRGGSDLTTLLRDISGVQIDPVVGSGAGVSLQGLGSDRVLVLLDGAPVAGRISGEFDITRFNPALFERIEIVDGPQSTLYGSSALGGVVNLLTRRDTTRRVELASQVGAFGQRDARGRLQGAIGQFGGSLDIGRRSVDVVPGHGGGTTGFAERWDVMARLGGREVTGPDLRLLWVGENQFYQTATRFNFNDNWQADLMARTTFGSAARTELRTHGSAYDHRFIASSTPEMSGGTPEWDKQRVLDAELLHQGTLGRHTWLGGAKLEREWLRTPRIDSGERAAWAGAVYGSADWMLGNNLQLVTGGRVTSSETWGPTWHRGSGLSFGASDPATREWRSPADFVRRPLKSSTWTS